MDLSNYKKIPSAPEYLLSPCGSVYSTKSNRVLKCSKNSAGYYRVGLTLAPNKVTFFLLHRLLAHTFLSLTDIYDSSLEVDHIDSCKENNSLSNLQVLTRATHLTKTLKDKGHTLGGAKFVPCSVCNNSTSSKKEPPICRTCSKELLSISEIEAALLTTGSWVVASRLLNISDTGLRKAYKRLSGKDPKTFFNQFETDN